MATELAMTAQQAVKAIASVRGYRERLTAQAAGIVWMVWGFVVAIAGLVTLYARDHNIVDGHKEAQIALWLVAVGGGALLTNAVWRAHALESEPRHAAWIPYAAGAGALAAVVILQELLSALFGQVLHSTIGNHMLGFSSLNLLGAAGAFTIAGLQKTRVSPRLGIQLGVVLLAFYLAGNYLTWPTSPELDFFASNAWVGVAMAGYIGVGLRTWRNG